MISHINKHPSSYRDPSGYIFEKEGVLYRQVNISFKEHFDHFIESGCYTHFAEKGFLIPHTAIKENLTGDADFYTTLQPQRLAYISFPYEWSFEMLKDAALLTLQLAKEALNFDMSLKDATPYNIQWHKGKLLFIDTLSFEKYKEEPWIAYRQFCESFLGPLLIMHYGKRPMQELQLVWPDGIPLAVIKSLLPKRSRFSLHTYLHIHLHAKVSAKKNTGERTQTPVFSKQKLLNLFSSLETLVKSLQIPALQSTWSDYYAEAAQRDDYLTEKKKLIEAWAVELQGIQTAADLGANEGEFSKLLAAKNISVIATDFDAYCIDNLYKQIKQGGDKNILPLIIDLANPSPATGVNNNEHASFINRTHVDIALALALIHHLVIGKNISFVQVACFFSNLSSRLIIEFVPKDDDKVKLMLTTKKDIYTDYNEHSFISGFEQYFTIRKRQLLGNSGRILFYMERNPLL